MPEGIDMTVRNKLVTEKRDLNVYQNSTIALFQINTIS
jgi:hypothetical protein